MKSVIIIEDHPVYRHGLKTILQSDFRVAGEATLAGEGLKLVINRKPDVALVDIKLPDYDGIRLTREITESTKTKVMIVSNHSKMAYVKQAIKAGAMGYVIKESGKECIVKCLHSIIDGRKFIDNSLSDKMCDYFSDEKGLEGKLIMYDRLSEREQEVTRLLVKDYTLKDIGYRLGISDKTVSSHKAKIMKKLKLERTRELLKFAMDIGLAE